jgi:Uma2 family endonuclease
MTAQRKPKLTVAEYLAIERRAEFKSEFYDGEMFAMAGASRHHNIVNENLSTGIGSRLKGGRSRTLSRDQRVRIERTGLYCYSDLAIVCGPPEYAAEDPDTLVNPQVIVEVLSDSTERYDRTTKFRQYQQLASVQEYVLVAQDESLCERYCRQADGSWSVVSFVGLEVTLELKSIPIRIPLAEIFTGVTFPDPPPR